jgi:hypothetical protein
MPRGSIDRDAPYRGARVNKMAHWGGIRPQLFFSRVTSTKKGTYDEPKRISTQWILTHVRGGVLDVIAP